MKRWLEELVINPNPVISSLCYSILRIEPYSTCPHSCGYCFRRWVADERKNLVNKGQIRAFNRLAEVIENRGLRIIPFRVSTLCDPFSKLERRYKVTLKVLRIARKRRIPLILSTKSPLVSEDPWLSEVEQLSRDGLILAQFTITTLDEDLWRELEAHAPSPIERLDAMEKLHKVGVPIILRLQPIIPGLNDSPDSLKEVIREARASGAERIIIECLRVKRGDSFAKEIGLKEKSLTPYFGSKYLLGVDPRYVRKISKLVRSIADSYGMLFSGCKETLFQLYTAENCCGIDLLKNACTRITVREVIRRAGGMNVSDLVSSLNELSREERFVKSHLNDLPRPIAKKIRSHQRVLRRILTQRRAKLSLYFISNH